VCVSFSSSSAAHRLDVRLERQLDVLRQAAPAHSFVASELPIQKTIVKTACENPDFTGFLTMRLTHTISYSFWNTPVLWFVN